MLYILATNAVDGSHYAAAHLGIPLRSQSTRAKLLCNRAGLPERFEADDVVRATPTVWDNRASVGLLWTQVTQRGGKVSPPFDYPQTMAVDDLNAWLES